MSGQASPDGQGLLDSNARDILLRSIDSKYWQNVYDKDNLVTCKEILDYCRRVFDEGRHDHALVLKRKAENYMYRGESLSKLKSEIEALVNSINGCLDENAQLSDQDKLRYYQDAIMGSETYRNNFALQSIMTSASIVGNTFMDFTRLVIADENRRSALRKRSSELESVDIPSGAPQGSGRKKRAQQKSKAKTTAQLGEFSESQPSAPPQYLVPPPQFQTHAPPYPQAQAPAQMQAPAQL